MRLFHRKNKKDHVGYWTRVYDRFGIDTFHKTQMSGRHSLSLFVAFIILVKIAGMILGLVDPSLKTVRHPSVAQSAQETLLMFIVVEIVPAVATVWLDYNWCNIKAVWHNFRIKHASSRFLADHPGTFNKKYPVHWTFISIFKAWTLRFYHGIIKHKRLLGLLFLFMLGLSILITFVGVILFSPQMSDMKSHNTASLLTDIKYAWPISLITIFIVPMIEELLFRCLMTNVFKGFFDLVFGWVTTKAHPRLVEFNYWLGAVISAVVFASLHDGFSPRQMIVYIALALFLQGVYKRSRSLVPGAVLHGMNNLLAVLEGL